MLGIKTTDSKALSSYVIFRPFFHIGYLAHEQQQIGSATRQGKAYRVSFDIKPLEIVDKEAGLFGIGGMCEDFTYSLHNSECIGRSPLASAAIATFGFNDF